MTHAAPVSAPPAAIPSPGTRSFSPEIQALRAFAVVAVVAYHLWPGAVPGGFVGVDVFFVLSGYLITGHMLREHARSGRFSLASFYARRVRRIAPAALLVLLATAAATPFLLPEPRWHEVVRTGIASVVSGTNWLLALDSVDYLAEGTAPSPFQHYWSLAVEEQFYLVWPLLAVAAIAWARRRRQAFRRVFLVSAATVFAVSLALSALSTLGTGPASYFATTTRAWELALGGLAAFVPALGWSPRTRTVTFGLAVAALVAVCLALDEPERYPGWLALLPCAATAVAVLAGETTVTGALGRAVRSRGVQWLGDASFSLYLWHWPVLLVLPDSPWLALVSSLALAWASRRYVEVPCLRAPASGPGMRRTFAVFVTASVAVAVAFVALAVVGDHRADRRADAGAQLLADPPAGLGPDALTPGGFTSFVATRDVIVPSPERARRDLPEGAEGRCKSDMGSPSTPVCEFGAPDADLVIALVGDSHAEQYLPALQSIAETHDARVLTFFHSSCPFSTAQRATDAARGGPCLTANDATLAALLADDAIDVVVTSARTAVPWAEGDVPADGFVEIWQALLADGLPIVVLGDNPLMLPDDGTLDCVAAKPHAPDECARPRSEAMPVDHQADAARRTPGVRWVDTTAWFCTDTTCPAVVGNVLVHRDEQHLTTTYARLLDTRVWAEIAAELRLP
ncbi:acyltransferase [Flavimobilis marinus]|uniref:Peptidoglycan/LPS O-acetylase OafA/YrhL, contains acyltransferase and SGNH-hydrolase domains n=1 Tax=Flavimobilis marinus TaxID=285351 RepID=A0A1I2DRU6_9MICO|nr:acyltransferase family protein [Flavimobilis marinus]GHG44486.1 acyltransferase [Flavimobilis marinus]SFE83352.1 Peptidoglycan/LPS O-acetylase OafA/YrhL, contains acyltransferase and SGNH-hydrolase domains [Flavimobilis marinus]